MDLEKKTEYLAEFMLDNRRERIEKVLAQRTRFLTVVLEDIYHAPNASAVIRSCECFGIQDLHVIENTKRYKPNADVVRGSAKWIDLHRYRGAFLVNKNATGDSWGTKESQPETVALQKEEDNTSECLSKLQEDGFKIVATTLNKENAITPDELPLDDPLALCFGTEELGVSETVYKFADYKLKIPMYGFTESFNISVAAALCLNTLSTRLRTSQIPWPLSEEEKNALRFNWYRKSVKNANKLLEKSG